jgi:rare lipoprotein A
MGFLPLSPQNWNRMFNIWIEDIQVQFGPVTLRAMDGGVLRRIRSVTRISAALVILFFSLHCTKPITAAGKAGKPAEGTSGETEGYSESGEASWYGSETDGFEGKFTASGDIMDSTQLTCAHKTLPLGTYLEVKNLDNGKRALLRINDRGPFVRGRIVDVSQQAAKDLGFLERGKANVRIRAVEKDGSVSKRWMAVDLSNPFTIQVAALADPANIESLSRELQIAIGPVTLMDATTREGQIVKRVRVGAYVSMDEAEKAAELVSKRFGARGVEPFITRRY